MSERERESVCMCVCAWGTFSYIYIHVCVCVCVCVCIYIYIYSCICGTCAVRVLAKTGAAAIFRGLGTVAENNVRVFKSHADPRNVSADKRLDTRGSEGAA